MRTVPCWVTGCRGICERGMWMCRECWHSVPVKLRKDLNSTWRDYRASPRLDTLASYEVARDAAIAAAVAGTAMSDTIAQPIVSELLSTSDLIRLISPRLLSRLPALSGQECVFQIGYVPGSGVRIDVLGILDRDGE